MFSNRYDGMRDLINNADEDVDCVTYATESSICHGGDSNIKTGSLKTFL